MGLVLRTLAEAAAALWVGGSVVFLASLLGDRAGYWVFYAGAYAGHASLCFQTYARGRWSFDVWLGAGVLASFLIFGFIGAEWPLKTVPVAWQDWFGGGGVNAVLMPYIHAAFWFAMCAAAPGALRSSRGE